MKIKPFIIPMLWLILFLTTIPSNSSISIPILWEPKEESPTLKDPLVFFNNWFNTWNKDKYKEYVENITYQMYDRGYGRPNNTDMQNWLTDTLRSVSNNKIFVQDVGNYNNIVGRLSSTVAPNKEDLVSPAIILMAHYDAGTRTWGADDNASGVAVLLVLAEILSQLNVDLYYNIFFAFTNAGELASAGASELTTFFARTNVEIVINFERLLFSPPILNHHFKDFKTSEYYSRSIQSKSLLYGNRILSTDSHRKTWAPPYGYPPTGDIYPFYLSGYPVVAISESFDVDKNPNPLVGGMNDLPDRPEYNYTYPIEVMRAILLTIIDWSLGKTSGYDFHVYEVESQDFTFISIQAKKSALYRFDYICKSNCQVYSTRELNPTRDGEIIGDATEGSPFNIRNGTKGSFFLENIEFHSGSYRIYLNGSINMKIMTGIDADGDNYLDYLGVFYFDTFFNPEDIDPPQPPNLPEAQDDIETFPYLKPPKTDKNTQDIGQFLIDDFQLPDSNTIILFSILELFIIMTFFLLRRRRVTNNNKNR